MSGYEKGLIARFLLMDLIKRATLHRPSGNDKNFQLLISLPLSMLSLVSNFSEDTLERDLQEINKKACLGNTRPMKDRDTYVGNLAQAS